MILTVERNVEQEAIEIYCDSEGLEFLVQRLAGLDKSGNGDHEHFMTPSWAGSELSEERQKSGNELVNHLCVVLLPKEAK